MQVIALAALIAQLLIGKKSPAALQFIDPRIGKTVPIFYVVSNSSSTSQVQNILDSFGPAHVLLYPRDPARTADLTDLPNNGETTHIVGISFDKLDIQSKPLS